MASNLARWANCFVPALAWCLLVMPGLFAAAQTIPDIDPSAVRTGLVLTSVLFIVLGAAFFAGVVWVARLALWAAGSDNRRQFSLLAAGLGMAPLLIGAEDLSAVDWLGLGCVAVSMATTAAVLGPLPKRRPSGA